ncbi:unnamed protein product, partial [Nesidiocoris tenuis]
MSTHIHRRPQSLVLKRHHQTNSGSIAAMRQDGKPSGKLRRTGGGSVPVTLKYQQIDPDTIPDRPSTVNPSFNLLLPLFPPPVSPVASIST